MTDEVTGIQRLRTRFASTPAPRRAG